MTASQFLASHEYDPNLTPQIVSTDEHFVWWNGSKRGAIIAILTWPFIGRTVHVRFEGDDTSFALSTIPAGNLSVSNFAPSRKNLQRRLYRAIRGARLWRRFPFASPNPELAYAAFVGNGGICQWVATNTSLANFKYHTYYPEAQPKRFSIDGANIVADAPDVLRAKISAELENPDSDASFARAASSVRLRDSSHWQKAIHDGRGQMRALWRLVCRAYGSPELLESGSYLKCHGFAMDDWQNAGVDVMPDTPKLRAWGKALLHFAPVSPRQMLPLQYLCVRDSIGSVNLNLGCLAREFWSLTFHEQLEARLELRDWANSNLPNEVVCALEQL